MNEVTKMDHVPIQPRRTYSSLHTFPIFMPRPSLDPSFVPRLRTLATSLRRLHSCHSWLAPRAY